MRVFARRCMHTLTSFVPCTLPSPALFLILLIALACPSTASAGPSETGATAKKNASAPAASPAASLPQASDFQIQSGPVKSAELKRLAETVQDGDILFQTTVSRQSLAIKIATKSDYTHCGIVFTKNGKPYVFEAVTTVSWTPLENWVQRGVKHHYVLMRLKKDQALTPDALQRMRDSITLFAGKEYDLLFQWSDAKIYCSELVWKLYQKAGIELCALRVFRDYDLDHEAVQTIVKERFGLDMPWDEKAVAPSDLMNCALLEVVAKN